MASLKQVIKQAETQCTTNGVRLTDKRKQVLSGLVKSKRALSAYELADYCREHFGESLPAMSVYRILEFLEAENLVHKLQLANKYVACAHITCEHAHGVPQFLICDDCNEVREIVIDESVITSLEQNVTQAGYTLTSQQIEMRCLCQKCSAT